MVETEVGEEREDGVLILVPAGRLDRDTARSFESLIMDRIGSGAEHVIVDFACLSFISSAGLRVLLLAAKRLHAGAGKLVLCDMQDHVRKIFEVSGFDQIIAIRDSRRSALELF